MITTLAGTCVREAGGSTLSAVSWLDGKEVWVQVTIVDGREAKGIRLSGKAALDFADDLKIMVPKAELL